MFFLFQRGLSQVSCHFLGWCFFPSLVIMVEVFLGVHLCPPLAERASEFERNSVELLSTNEMCWAESINLSEVQGKRSMSHLKIIHTMNLHMKDLSRNLPPPRKQYSLSTTAAAEFVQARDVLVKRSSRGEFKISNPGWAMVVVTTMLARIKAKVRYIANCFLCGKVL